MVVPASSEKQASLFRVALGNPNPGTSAYKIKHTVPPEKISHFTHVAEESTGGTGSLSEATLNYDQFALVTRKNWPNRPVNALSVTPSEPTVEMTLLGDTDVTFTAKSAPSTTGKTHECHIVFYPTRQDRAEMKAWWSAMHARFRKMELRRVPKRIMTAEDLRKMRCKCNCGCEDFKYSFEVANAKKGLSSVEVSNGQSPDIRNPDGKVGMCKHLLSLIKYLVRDTRASTRLREQYGRDLNTDERDATLFAAHSGERQHSDATKFGETLLDEIGEFAGRIKHANGTLKKVGSGSGRVVYELNNALVAKIAKNRKGVAQNESEANSVFNKFNCVAKTLECGKGHAWVIAEKAEPIENFDQFKELAGGTLDFNTYMEILYVLFSPNGKRKLSYAIAKEAIKKAKGSKFCMEVIKMMHGRGATGLIVSDLIRMENLGKVKRGGKYELVVIDYGLTHEVYGKHYG